ncbi:hypothetical protein HDV00_001321 [Rhizophlyctis rosea]|nr:hypothetical protein HDV00_001321 [Rhizophlyctis rosea]
MLDQPTRHEKLSLCYITSLPDLVLFSIFEHIQPASGDIVRFHLKEFNGSNTHGNIPYELLLAQVCKTFRIIAFRLRRGNCLDVGDYLPFSRRAQADRAYDVFLCNPLRVASVRTLHLHADFGRKLLEAIDLTKLRHIVVEFRIFDAEVDTCVNESPSVRLARLTDAFKNASLVGQSLNLQTCKVYLDSEEVDVYASVIQFLQILQSSPLESLEIMITSDGNNNTIHPPTHLSFKSLKSCKTNSSNILFPNWLKAMPNLITLYIRENYPLKLVSFKTLTQPSITNLTLDARFPHAHLATIPSSTLTHLTSLTINYPAISKPDQLNALVEPLSQMHNLISLTLSFITSSPCYEYYSLTFNSIAMCKLLSSLNCQGLERLRFHVVGWEYQRLCAALEGWRGVLKDLHVDVILKWETEQEGKDVLERGRESFNRDLDVRIVTLTPWFQLVGRDTIFETEES